MKGSSDYRQEAIDWRDNSKKNSRPLRVIIIALLILLAALFVLVVWPEISKSNITVANAKEEPIQPKDENSLSADSAEVKIPEQNPNETTAKTMVIYLTGAVQNPGVFELEKGKRLNDVIVMAGGLSEVAAKNYINLAQVVQDEMHIHIPSTEEIDSGEAQKIADASGIELSPNSRSNGLQAGANDASAQSGIVNINTATQQELITLPGVGQATANKIVDYRETNGAFKTVEELKKVSGIGDKKYADLVDKICV